MHLFFVSLCWCLALDAFVCFNCKQVNFIIIFNSWILQIFPKCCFHNTKLYLFEQIYHLFFMSSKISTLARKFSDHTLPMRESHIDQTMTLQKHSVNRYGLLHFFQMSSILLLPPPILFISCLFWLIRLIISLWLCFITNKIKV